MAEILHQLISSFPIIYMVLYIPGGAGFLNHQQYAFGSFREGRWTFGGSVRLFHRDY